MSKSKPLPKRKAPGKPAPVRRAMPGPPNDELGEMAGMNQAPAAGPAGIPQGQVPPAIAKMIQMMAAQGMTPEQIMAKLKMLLGGQAGGGMMPQAGPPAPAGGGMMNPMMMQR